MEKVKTYFDENKRDSDSHLTTNALPKFKHELESSGSLILLLVSRVKIQLRKS